MIGRSTGRARRNTDQHEGMNSQPWLVGVEFFFSFFPFFFFPLIFFSSFFVPLSAGRYSRSGNTLRPPHHIS